MTSSGLHGADPALTAWAPSAAGQPTRWAEVDPAAIRDNVAAISGHLGDGVALMAMVKANGYGHGAVLSAEAAVSGGATWLGVATAGEALQLSRAGLRAEILTVGWSHPSQLSGLVEAGVHITAWDPEAIIAITAAAAATGRPARVHLKLDSGMGRLGARMDAIPQLLRAVSEARDAVEVVAIFTHFADADGADLDFSRRQHRAFLEAVASFASLGGGVLLHCANSAATLRLPETHHDIVRVGIALYGYPPAGCQGVVGLRPAMAMKAYVTQVKTVRAGESVGYGRTWFAPRDTRVATVAAGYGDGLQRAQSGAGSLLVGGVRCPIVGSVSMDQASVDVSAVAEVVAGDEAVVFGGQGDAWLGADDVADAVGTISYEVLCSVSARVPRLIVDEA